MIEGDVFMKPSTIRALKLGVLIVVLFVIYLFFLFKFVIMVNFANVYAVMMIILFLEGATFFAWLKYYEEFYLSTLGSVKGSLHSPEPEHIGLWDVYRTGGYTFFQKTPGKDALLIVPRIGGYTLRFGKTVLIRAVPINAAFNYIPVDVAEYVEKIDFPRDKLFLCLDAGRFDDFHGKVDVKNYETFAKGLGEKAAQQIVYAHANGLNQELAALLNDKYDNVDKLRGAAEALSKSFNDPSKMDLYNKLVDKIKKQE